MYILEFVSWIWSGKVILKERLKEIHAIYDIHIQNEIKKPIIESFECFTSKLIN